ncbi:MAG TPA: glycosyltransferase family 39 protein [Mycobacteriales bacterium]|nr:glycosyltransferase family 39 protein [Mycobacteriales bacterium]
MTAVRTLEAVEPPVVSRARRDRPPALVWALLGLHVAIMVMCSILYPATYGYDEPQHIDMAYAYSKGLHLYAPAERRVAEGVAKTQRGPGFPPRQAFTDFPVRPRDQRPSFDEQGGNHQLQGGLPNQQVQHPPLYYLMGAAVLHVPGVGGLHYDQQIWLLRLLSMLALAPLPLLAWATAKALLGPGPPALLAAVLPLTVPGLSRIGASFTNDSLLTLLGAVVVWLLARVLAGDFRLRTAALLGGALVAALLTKGFALVLPPVVLAGYVVAGLRHRRRPVAPALVALGLSGLGLLWWVRNLILYGAVQPNGWGPEAYARIVGPPRPAPGGVVQFAHGFAYRLGLRIWGGIGLPEKPRLAIQLCFGWTFALLLLIAVGLLVGTRARWSRASLALLCLPAVLTTLVVASQSWSLFSTHGGKLVAIQGRYLYVGLTGLGVAFAAGLLRILPRRWARWAPGAVLVLGVATQVWAWRTLTQAWWVPADARGRLGPAVRGVVDGLATWSPFPAGPTFAPFLAAVALAVVALVLAFRTSGDRWVAPPPPRPAPDAPAPPVPSARP